MEQYIGKLLDGRYEILEIIGVGGMAVVYKAMDHRLNRLVAVKILKDDYLNDADFRRRFHGESQAVAMMSHPNIVSVYDVSRSEGNEYIVMELIDGITLKQYMDQRSPLSWRETLHFSMQIAKALEHAHSRNIIHRDIKPHNVMILKDGSVKVADFGIARIASAANTLTKEALGSVHYISPEQARGARVDNRSDIYSLGVVMYEMLTGRPPYDGETPVSVAIQHINGTPLSPSLLNSDIPTGLEQITMHAMCSDLNIRYASITDMLKDMEEFRKDPAIRFTFLPKGGSATGTGAGNRIQPAKPQNVANRQKELEREYERQDREEKRRRIWMIAAISLAVLALIVLLFLVLGQSGSSEATTTAPNGTVGTSAETAPEVIYVPQFIGDIYDEILRENYPYLNLVSNESSYVYNDKYPMGVVCDQAPGVGEKVPPGTEIFLYISMGERMDKMPKLAGYSAENANSILKAMEIKLTILIEKEYSDEVPEGYVTRTDPEEDTELKNGRVVTIYVSKGPRLVQVPKVTGASAANAAASLNARKLEVQTREDYSSTVSAGYVISQSPEAGTEVEEGTVVTITVSKGKQTITLFGVTGKTEEEATDLLTSQGLSVKTETEHNNYVPAGQVLRQSPEGGEEVMPGSTVTLTISLGPVPPPSTSEEPSESTTESSEAPEPSESESEGEETP
ncbi:MAG: Stk1 family PASTA domain-containing Ser/Thr kinase [Oscillospiraceae bacterium]|nr:Stk1 family PASTA domain-containing Ser/Thr kinase [Oscillospiraceae bacterium]MBQ6160322.1 Stk1 family PASTA domain-containing Ser/Thr kinase [Oscillospiraceae bacterium]